MKPFNPSEEMQTVLMTRLAEMSEEELNLEIQKSEVEYWKAK